MTNKVCIASPCILGTQLPSYLSGLSRTVTRTLSAVEPPFSIESLKDVLPVRAVLRSPEILLAFSKLGLGIPLPNDLVAFFKLVLGFGIRLSAELRCDLPKDVWRSRSEDCILVMYPLSSSMP